MERLAKNINGVICYVGKHKQNDEDVPAEMTTAAVRDVLTSLFAYEEAEEKGRLAKIPENTSDIDFMRFFELIMADAEKRLVVLPCKVGSTVYWIPDLFTVWDREMWETKVMEQGLILTDTVAGFRFYGEHELRLVLPNLGIEPIYPHKHLFFTREEAEAALNKTT